MTDHIGHPCRHTIYYVNRWVYSLKTELPLHCTLCEFIHFPYHIKLAPQTFLFKKPWVVPLIFPYKVIAGENDAYKKSPCVCVHLWASARVYLSSPMLFSLQEVTWLLLSSPNPQKMQGREYSGFAVLRLNPTNKMQYKGEDKEMFSWSQWL